MSVATPLSSTNTQSPGATAARGSAHAARAAATSGRACSSGPRLLFFPPQVEPLQGPPDRVDAHRHARAVPVERRQLVERAVVALLHQRRQHRAAGRVDLRVPAAGVRRGGGTAGLADAAAPLVDGRLAHGEARGDLGLRLLRGGGDHTLAQVQRIRLWHTATPTYSPPHTAAFPTPESSYGAENCSRGIPGCHS